jgi:restriction system protein
VSYLLDLDKKIIDTTNMSLKEWLTLLEAKDLKDFLFEDYMFPTDAMREEYISTINNRSDEDVIKLLRNFLIPSGNLGSDRTAAFYLITCLKNDKERFKYLYQSEYYKRLLKSIIDNKSFTWEGNTWIIDLLPHFPSRAIEALYAYYLAHAQFLPDGRLSGLEDAIAIIRAKFINITYPYHVLSDLEPYQFEQLIESLYHEMGYITKITKRTRDGGKDVIAEKVTLGERATLLISCKKQKTKVSVKELRELLGILSNERATKGVLVCTSEFTKPALDLAKENKRLELIGCIDLQILLNEYFGPKWPIHLDDKILESISRNIINNSKSI